MMICDGLNPAGETGLRYRVGSPFRIIRDGAGETETADIQWQAGGKLTKQGPAGRVGEGLRVNSRGNLPVTTGRVLLTRSRRMLTTLAFWKVVLRRLWVRLCQVLWLQLKACGSVRPVLL
jgi:hypothetical protein